MAAITAAAVMALREKTGLPMMECKKALTECGGDTEQAVDWLRKQGVKTQAMRADRETSMGRLAIYTDLEKGVGALIELKCESAPVAGSPGFKDFVNDIAKTLALGPGAASPEELLDQKSQAHPDKTLRELKDDLFNRMREVFELSRICRIDAPCGGYAHHDGSKAALVEISGETTGSTAAEVAKDVAMHIVALSPQAIVKEDLDQTVVDKEREILTEAARQEGKPDNIIQKMIEGRLRNFFSQCVLLEQPFVKDDKQSVGKLVKSAGLKVKRMEHWKIGSGD
ncbi:MAG: translation elongation factor Ts [Planctomycetaceae bacterium]|jgi:elongation factor Ts|nr:translation elongation factor Ts [Planctomycetaceae bacterium]MBT4158694.1 translation elongation factor Ts [Planctomycetaceae bacterium]MBT4886293.1 translation elongation factor Ts [Planctomycetaceae bacterium]MBT6054647.1 translation elongation factor Ts [Planctomycetaceae bacterium]MBT6460861.1 translation elongation factor Ts [Planctomycetaceae bacterium]